jgi:hypothetical protein
MRGAPLKQGEQHPAEQRGSDGDAVTWPTVIVWMWLVLGGTAHRQRPQHAGPARRHGRGPLRRAVSRGVSGGPAGTDAATAGFPAPQPQRGDHQDGSGEQGGAVRDALAVRAALASDLVRGASTTRFMLLPPRRVHRRQAGDREQPY